jgi:hypothetical protein
MISGKSMLAAGGHFDTEGYIFSKMCRDKRTILAPLRVLRPLVKLYD